MIRLFAREERDAKRQSLNDPLALLARHIATRRSQRRWMPG